MKNKNTRIIFQLKEGVAPVEVLPNNLMLNEAPGFQVRRLYEIGEEVASLRANVPAAETEDISDEEFFDKNIYANKPEPEKKMFRTYVAEGSREVVEGILDTLKADKNIEYAQYDEINELYQTPNDPLLSQLWGLLKIDCETAWNHSQGEEIVVAVIDTGVDYEHPDIEGRLWKDSAGNIGKDFSDGDDDPLDFHGHGTHCAGTIAATIDNLVGVVGVAPKAKIMALKIFPNAFDSVCSTAIKFAADNGARVLSNSWGPSDRRPSNKAVEDAIDYANAKGCIVVFAAGNEDDDVQFYSPANRPNVISVAATTSTDNRAGFSNFGNLITIAAPGVGILSLKSGTNQYTSKSGTSMACPHVAGLVALLLAENALTLDEVKENLLQNADPIQTDKPISGHRINAGRSITALSAPQNGKGAKKVAA